MNRALIDPENSLLRNAIGLILFVPITLVAIVMALPFALIGRPAKTTATEVAVYLNDLIEDKGEAWDWDNFISVPIANPKLESIRARASQVELPVNEEGLVALRLLLSEVEGLNATNDERLKYAIDNLKYIHLNPSNSLPVMALNQPFSAVIVINTEVTSDWRNEVSEWLVEEGCLYMMAWGKDCSLWDDSVDWANIAAHENGEISDDQHVFTTWHENEPLGDAFWFAYNSAVHPKVPLKQLIILDITDKPREEDIRKLFANTCT